MKITNINGFKTIDAYVKHKLNLLENSDKSMKAIYALAFSESQNVMFEESVGFKIKKTTYGEVDKRIKRLSRGLKERLGAIENGRVGIYAEDPETFIVTFWCLIISGYNPVLLNAKLLDTTVEKCLKDFSVSAVITEGKTFSVRSILFSDLSESDEAFIEGDYGKEFYVTSSGTEHVKICAYTAKELCETVKNSSYVISKNLSIKAHYKGELKLLAFLPFYHIFGFIAVYFWFSFFSRTFVKLASISPLTIQNTIKKHGVTHVFAVPLFWDTVYKKAIKTIKSRGEKTNAKFYKGLKISLKLGNGLVGKAFKKIALKVVRENIFGDSIKFMISGGSVISPEVLRFFNGIGYTLVNGYGSSEIGVTSVELSSKTSKITDASIGSPLPTIDYRIDENGELWVKGTSTASAVYSDGAPIKSGDDWYNTHDLAIKVGDRYYLSGRSDDLIISVTGENLNPSAIEEKFFGIDAEGVILIATKENKLPTLIVSVSEYCDEEKANLIRAEVNKIIKANDLTAQIGEVLITKDPLIVGKEFKLNRKRLSRDCGLGLIKPFSASVKNDEELDAVTRTVRLAFSEVLTKKPSAIGLYADFFTEMGGTSLDYFSMVARIKAEFSVEIPDGATLNTVSAVASYIKENL